MSVDGDAPHHYAPKTKCFYPALAVSTVPRCCMEVRKPARAVDLGFRTAPIGLVRFRRRLIIFCLLHVIVLLQVIVVGFSCHPGTDRQTRTWQNGSRAATMYAVSVTERSGHE